MSLLPAERAQYSAIIDGILNSSDLNTVSAKQISQSLAAALNADISDKKQAVKQLIMERYDYAQEKASAPIPTTEAPATNGFAQKGVKTEPKVKSETPQSSTSRDMTTPSASKSEPASDSDEDIPPPKRKRKQAGSKEMDDAKLAAMLQAQENNRGRSTRGGGSAKKQKVVKKRTPKKKSEKKVGADDDSEMEVGSDGEVKQKVKKGGFHKQYHLSAPLADLVGEPTLSRPQVVKKIWAYIKARDLQDPADKRQIRCDDKMQLVFKQDKVHMFTMNKILGNQLYPVDE